MNRKLVLASVALAVLLASVAASGLVYWYGWPGGGAGLADVSFSTQSGNASFECEVADSPTEWSDGLSGREELAQGRGMLFVFPSPSQQTFWMKETLIPLDIVFVWANGTVGAIFEAPAEPGVSDSDLTRYESPGPVKWVVELNMGTCAASGIVVGSQMAAEG
jgi:uncharacterized membrane protein (UPF0127 family)